MQLSVYLHGSPVASQWGFMAFSDWLNNEREKRGWTQEWLADQADTTKSTIQRLENGLRKPSRGMVTRITNALASSVSDPRSAEEIRKAGVVAAGFLPETDGAGELVTLRNGMMVNVIWREGEPGTPLELDDQALAVLEALNRGKAARQ